MNEWKTPGKKSIVKCAVNQRQVVIALSGGELVYFEMDPVSRRAVSCHANSACRCFAANLKTKQVCFRPGCSTDSCLLRVSQTGQLNEYTERKEMSADVICMALGRVPHGEQRCRFLAVGLADSTVRIISLDPTVSGRA